MKIVANFDRECNEELNIFDNQVTGFPNLTDAIASVLSKIVLAICGERIQPRSQAPSRIIATSTITEGIRWLLAKKGETIVER